MSPIRFQGDNKLLPKTMHARESVWEALDKIARMGDVEFKSHELWQMAVYVPYQQAITVLRQARELGWVERVNYAKYRISPEARRATNHTHTTPMGYSYQLIDHLRDMHGVEFNEYSADPCGPSEVGVHNALHAGDGKAVQ